jgi:7-cyano-7-deazaguanine synthase in queuosine biosynthesis
MGIERVVYCGGCAEGHVPFADDQPLHLRRFGSHANVRVFFGDLRLAMWSDVPDEFEDLIDIAAYVYCADQAVSRGVGQSDETGALWRRRLFLRVPVRLPDLWRSDRVRPAIEELLSFLTEDEVAFDFVPAPRAEFEQTHINYDGPSFGGDVDEVALFSTGVDSTAGVCRAAIRDRRQVLMVNHRSIEKMASRHFDLLQRLRDKAGDRAPLHLAVRVQKRGIPHGDSTQRSRSFLYMTLGATAAVMSGLRALSVYENGVTSINLPPCAQVVGSRASRTTHPQVIAGMSELVAAFSGRPFKVETPFVGHTKTDVVETLREVGCIELLPFTSSCAQTRQRSAEHPHCGSCSQCIDRRLAVLAAGVEQHDPVGEYEVDLLVGERPEGEARTMLASLIETATKVAKMTPVDFFSKYGEVSRALRHMDGDPAANALAIFRLYQKHARQVTSGLDGAASAHLPRLREHGLPAGCGVCLVYGDSAPVTTTVPTHWNGGPVPADNVFWRCGKAWLVRYAGRGLFILPPERGVDYLHHLVRHAGESFACADLVAEVTGEGRIRLAGDAGPVDDRQAMAEQREEATRLRAELERARKDNDEAGIECARAEMLKLAQAVKHRRGLRGQTRRAGDRGDSVRVAFHRAVIRALKHVREYDTVLAEHFEASLKLGWDPIYAPPSAVPWVTEQPP